MEKIWFAQLTNSLEELHPGGTITVASGISPSGPVHMGNLREVMTGAAVAEELRGRGRAVRHILSWDNYDRFRRVPAGVEGVDESWETFVGRPLSEVPPPPGSSEHSWAAHFSVPLSQALAALGVEVEEVFQAERYTSGSYLRDMVLALDEREAIGEVLARHKTKGEVLEPATYYPFKAYCHSCGRDTTTGQAWHSAREEFSYSCSCGHSHTASLEDTPGKLVWKVDWPMRWAHERVSFEPAGRDHMSPGSSWTVAEELVKIFHGRAPLPQAYSFVGIEGQAKMASSKGGAPTPGELLPLMGAPLMRWLYLRSRPEQAFSLNLQQLPRLAEEWEALQERVRTHRAEELAEAVWEQAAQGFLPPAPSVKFSAWASFADLTLCQPEAMEMLAEAEGAELTYYDRDWAKRARLWVERCVPQEERTQVVPAFRGDYWATLTSEEQDAVELLAEGLEEHWDELTRWSFGVPKVIKGFSLDERKLPPEAKAFQKSYFTHLYQLLVGREKGPRLPSLLMTLGVEEARHLLTGR